jgi:hypothetical protein
MATTPGTIKHRHHSVLPEGTSDVDVSEWNDSEVVAGGTNGDALVRDTAQADGWGWTPLSAYAPPAATSRCMVYNNAVQSIPNTTTTILTFNSEDYDVTAMHVAGDSLISIPVTGGYLISARTQFAANATGQRTLFLYEVIGNTMLAELNVPATTGGFITTLVIPGIPFAMTAGQQVHLRVYQASGGALDAGSATRADASQLSVIRLW